MPIQGTRSIDPPSEHDLRTRISNQRRPKMQRLWRCRSVRQLDIIRHYNVGQHGFQHACGKETSRANIQSVIFHGRWKQAEGKTIPRTSTMSKGQILGRCRDKLILHTLTLHFSQSGKPEGLECMGILVERIIIVYGPRSYDDRGALWYNRAVRELEIFQHLTRHTRWVMIRMANALNGETSTSRYAFETLGLLEEAVHFSHLAQRSFRPSLHLDDCFNLLTKGLDILRIRREVEECMSEVLPYGVSQACQGCNINPKLTREDV